jgi:hypothetical protein
MAAKSPLSELREMNVRRQRETQNVQEETEAVSAPPSLDPTDSVSSNLESNGDSNLDSYPSSNVATKQSSNLAVKQDSYVSSNIATKAASELARPEAVVPGGVPVGPPVGPSVTDMRKTSLEQLNIRIPAGFNEWLAEEAHRRRREGVTKQSLVADALEAMIRLQREEGNQGAD